ncbi:MAG: Ldh family oxidoreductase [Gammaproteobacteria bacterium]|nr:Ldh family oxidoreductase [Gammaproteobacteria bacterium]MDH3537912.1 Ldh family oxidoreductase [Gammaproteobacteria bacterium]
MTEKSRTLILTEVDDLARRALAACGAHGRQLELAVQSVVDAECDGIRTVGLGYLPLYCGHLQVGKINRDAVPSHAQIAPSVLRSMADSGFAHAAFADAEDAFYVLARQQGIAALSIVDSYSAGVVGWFVQRMATAGLIGLGFANSPSAVAPAPGAGPFFGTNPMAFAIPRGERDPIIADMATSQVALVTIKKAAAEGRSIPLGWGYDADGNDTTDAAAVINGGALAPAGGYKGMLLGLLVDLLAGVLSGPHCSFQAPVFKNNTGGEPRVGQFFIAISPGGLTPGGDHAYADRLETMLAALAAEPGVRLPGARRHESRLKAETDGVDVPLELIEKLEGFAASA